MAYALILSLERTIESPRPYLLIFAAFSFLAESFEITMITEI